MEDEEFEISSSLRRVMEAWARDRNFSGNRTYMENSLGDKHFIMEYDMKIDLADFYRGAEKKLRLRYDDPSKNQILTFVVGPGCREGVRVKFEKKAWFAEGNSYGDLVVVLKEKGNSMFHRKIEIFPDEMKKDYRPDNQKYADLVYFLEITVHEAIMGFTKSIRHMDGRLIKVSHQGVDAENQEEIIIKEEGMPIRSLGRIIGRGDLYVRLKVI